MTEQLTCRTVTFTVYGLPAPQGSKRHVGRGIMVESSKKIGPWRDAVTDAIRYSLPSATYDRSVFDGPLAVTILFRMPRLASHFGTGRNAGTLKPGAPYWHTSYPDVSKLVRSTEDAIVQAGLIRDDARIARLTAHKTYANGDDPWTGATITIEQIR